MKHLKEKWHRLSVCISLLYIDKANYDRGAKQYFTSTVAYASETLRESRTEIIEVSKRKLTRADRAEKCIHNYFLENLLKQRKDFGENFIKNRLWRRAVMITRWWIRGLWSLHKRCQICSNLRYHFVSQFIIWQTRSYWSEGRIIIKSFRVWNGYRTWVRLESGQVKARCLPPWSDEYTSVLHMDRTRWTWVCGTDVLMERCLRSAIACLT